jgi:hypothetical protein
MPRKVAKWMEEELAEVKVMPNQVLLECTIDMARDLFTSDFSDRDYKILKLYYQELSERLMKIKWIDQPLTDDAL